MAKWINELDPYTANRLVAVLIGMIVVAVFWLLIRSATDHPRK